MSVRQWQAGFSYVWLMLAVALTGVGLMLGEEIYHTSVRRDKERELLFIGRQMRNAIQKYYDATPGGGKQYPENLESLLLDPRSPGIRRHLRKIYVDPMTGKAEWALLLVGGKIAGVHSLSDEQPLKVANFNPSEAGFEGRKKYSEWIFSYPSDLVAGVNGGTGDATAATSSGMTTSGGAPTGTAPLPDKP